MPLLIRRELFVQGPFVYFNPQITDLSWQSSKVRRPLTSLPGQVQGSAHVTMDVKSFWYMVELVNVSTTMFVSFLRKQHLERLKTFRLFLNNIRKQFRNVWWIWCILSKSISSNLHNNFSLHPENSRVKQKPDEQYTSRNSRVILRYSSIEHVCKFVLRREIHLKL